MAINFSDLVQPVVQYRLFNPGDKEVEFDFGAETFRIPPNGELLVRDRRSDLAARDIVIFAVGENGEGGRVGGIGVRPLFGDGRDTEVKRMARQSWLEAQYLAARAIVHAHERAVALAQETGTEAPRPTSKVLEAYKMMAEHENLANFAASCPICNLGFHDAKEVDGHIMAIHKNSPKAAEIRTKMAAIPTPDAPDDAELMSRAPNRGIPAVKLGGKA